jgi:lipopolysaccharide biosynthesis glycosyltransferase
LEEKGDISVMEFAINMTNKSCIAYVTDQNLIFPTIVSAIQAKRWCLPTTDVLIINSTVNFDLSMIQKVCKDSGIYLIDASKFISDPLSGLSNEEFGGRITKACMGRLLLGEIIPESYEQIIYLDGDTQIFSSLKCLEKYEVPEGKFLASPDYTTVFSYLNGSPLGRYFNSGVIKFNRNGWIGPAALQYYLCNGGESHDQGALNNVGSDALILMSSRWNFPKQFLHLLQDDKPTIIHFMAHPKPWDGIFFPWSAAQSIAYDDAIKLHPILKRYRKKISFNRRIIYSLRSIRERLQNIIAPVDRSVGLLLDGAEFDADGL